MQLNCLAAASASSLVSKSAGVPFCFDSVAQPIKESESPKIKAETMGLKVFKINRFSFDKLD